VKAFSTSLLACTGPAPRFYSNSKDSLRFESIRVQAELDYSIWGWRFWSAADNLGFSSFRIAMHYQIGKML